MADRPIFLRPSRTSRRLKRRLVAKLKSSFALGIYDDCLSVTGLFGLLNFVNHTRSGLPAIAHLPPASFFF